MEDLDKQNKDDGLQKYIERISKAVRYSGTEDHEDVRSILKQLIDEREREARINEIERLRATRVTTIYRLGVYERNRVAQLKKEG